MAKALFGVFVLAIVFFAIIDNSTNSGGSSASAVAAPAAPRSRNTAENAQALCAVFVEEQLKAPSTAKFDYPKNGAMQSPVDSLFWAATVYVDAENSFGAMLRAGYLCELTYVPASDQWRLNNLHQLPR